MWEVWNDMNWAKIEPHESLTGPILMNKCGLSKGNIVSCWLIGQGATIVLENNSSYKQINILLAIFLYCSTYKLYNLYYIYI